MTRILALADLHWDLWRECRIDPFAALAPDTKAAIGAVFLAGDLCNHGAERWSGVFDAIAQHFTGAKLYAFPGNHDHYGGAIDREDKLRDACAKAGVTYAHRRAITLGPRRILSCTLWTDMELGGHKALNMMRAESMMNDYRKIRIAGAGYRRLRPADSVQLHVADRAWLEAELDKPFAGETIVITHHAPVPPRPDTDLSPAYGSHLCGMIGHHQPVLWLYGHTHAPQTDRFGQTDVRNISLGYPGEWEHRMDSLGSHLERLVL